ncbi:ChbG/HpnK family deacetylase [Variovorax sp. RT4R15]|uniref:ChbG/HpnK family deacetylase n=1 Tax=Variovorax sp. RT4R15 TaxID=3443737 RepID=UPI003F47D0D4
MPEPADGKDHCSADRGVILSAASRHLCICADDFGLDAGVNAAVFDLAEHGKISATSCMVRRSAWRAGVPGLRGMDAEKIDIGLHLDLTRPGFERGAEPGLLSLMARSYMGFAEAEVLRSEIGDQLNRFEDALGRPPAFVDGHRHVHQLPVVRDVLLDEIAHRFSNGSPWVRCTVPGAMRGMGRLKANLIFALGGHATRDAAARRGISMSNRLLGVYDFKGNAEGYRNRMGVWLEECRTGDVLMCHPSLGAASEDPISKARRQEYAVLRTIRYPLRTRSGAVTLTPLSRLLAGDQAGHG